MIFAKLVVFWQRGWQILSAHRPSDWSRADDGRADRVEPLGEICGFSLVLEEQSRLAELRQWGVQVPQALGGGEGEQGFSIKNQA